MIFNVDIQLPPLEEVKRPEMLEKLTVDAANNGQSGWEAGAQSNFMIAAARLGLRVASAANLGQDVYGDFLRDILKASLSLEDQLYPVLPRLIARASQQSALG